MAVGAAVSGLAHRAVGGRRPAVCGRCGLENGGLTTHCPGEVVDFDRRELMRLGKLDFRDGFWVAQRCPHRWFTASERVRRAHVPHRVPKPLEDGFFLECAACALPDGRLSAWCSGKRVSIKQLCLAKPGRRFTEAELTGML